MQYIIMSIKFSIISKNKIKIWIKNIIIFWCMTLMRVKADATWLYYDIEQKIPKNFSWLLK